jgi:hypothetical protein
MAFDFTSLIGPAVGGIFGALGSSGGNQQTQTQTQNLDPRMANAVYGNLVPGITDWYQDNKSGLNPIMLQGLNQQYNALQDPFTSAGYNRMGQNGYNLMGGGVAGNPFTNGWQTHNSGSGGLAPASPSTSVQTSGWGGGSLGLGNSVGPFAMPTGQTTSGGVTQNTFNPSMARFAQSMSTDGSHDYGSPDTSGWGSMTDAQKADYYSGNPTMGRMSNMALGAMGLTSVGAMAKAMNPEGWRNQDLISRGYDPAAVFSGDTGMGRTANGQTFSNDATIGMQDASNFGGVQSSVGFADVSANNGMGVTANGTTVSNDASIAAQDAANFGGNATGSGGADSASSKIICTAMNEAYGFGSYRQAVWLKYSENMTKEHEAGYHAMFLPLVKYGFKSGDGFFKNIVRKVLEHGTRHRTADLRAEMYGRKRDKLGRFYRAIFEPLCYAVGKVKGA